MSKSQVNTISKKKDGSIATKLTFQIISKQSVKNIHNTNTDKEAEVLLN